MSDLLGKRNPSFDRVSIFIDLQKHMCSQVMELSSKDGMAKGWNYGEWLYILRSQSIETLLSLNYSTCMFGITT